MNIQTCRARSKRTGGWVYGYLTELWTEKGMEQRYAIDQCSEYDYEGNSLSVEEIDISTLQYRTPYKACAMDSLGGICANHEIYEGDLLAIKLSGGGFGPGHEVFYDDGWKVRYPGDWNEGLGGWLDEWRDDRDVFITGNVIS